MKQILSNIFRKELLLYVVTFLTIFTLCIYQYAIYSPAAWPYPIGYGGDAYFLFAIIKTLLDEHSIPFIAAVSSKLNAPFMAAWSDYPLTEKGIYETFALVARFIGIYSASTVMLVMAHVLAALSFVFASRLVGCSKTFAFSGGIIFGAASFIFSRGLAHINVAYCWHVPVLTVVTWWMFSSKNIEKKSKEYNTSIIISFISGFFNPYYSFMYVQFLLMSVVMHAVRKNYDRIKLPLICISLVVIAFIMANFDYFSYRFEHGKNYETAGRNLAALEVYGLKLPELFFPAGGSRISAFSNFAQYNYYIPSFVKGEMWSPYLGLVGIFGLILLTYRSVINLFKGNYEQIPLPGLQVLWIMMFSLIGGVNLLFGVFGLQLFRASNRFSIFILAICLIFLFKYLSDKLTGKRAIFLAGFLILIALADQTPQRYTPVTRGDISSRVIDDQKFVNAIESYYPDGAQVFTLPLARFPESPPVLGMTDYEHFRIYLNSDKLHITYGAQKGRGNEDWQREIYKNAVDKFIYGIEGYGFDVIMINKKGIEPDKFKEFTTWLKTNKRNKIAESTDLIAFALRPVDNPTLPKSTPIYRKGWSTPEGNFIWSTAKKSTIIYHNRHNKPITATIKFDIQSLGEREIKVSLNSEVIIDVIQIGPKVESLLVRNIQLRPGANFFKFETDKKPMLPGNGDPRLLSFRIFNLTIGE